MNHQATMEKMKEMKLYGMLRAFKNTMEGVKNQFTPDELLSHLVETEWEDRQNRKLQRLAKQARFRHQAYFEEIDFSGNRNLDKNQMLRLSSCDWVHKKKNIIVTGPTGAGKSFISCALGNQCCANGLRVLYFNCSKLFPLFKLWKADGSYIRELKKIERKDVLIIDDFGLQPFDLQTRLSLLEVLEDRYGRKSTVVISQLPVKNWHEIIGDQTIADAVCDRIIHNSIRIELKGGSVRKKYSENS